MRYLLDELTAYEEGFSDILLLDRATDRHETFMGGAESKASTTVSYADLQAFGAGLIQQFQSILSKPTDNTTTREDAQGRLYFLSILLTCKADSW